MRLEQSGQWGHQRGHGGQMTQGLKSPCEDFDFYFECLAKLLSFYKILLAARIRKGIGRERNSQGGQ